MNESWVIFTPLLIIKLILRIAPQVGKVIIKATKMIDPWQQDALCCYKRILVNCLIIKIMENVKDKKEMSTKQTNSENKAELAPTMPGREGGNSKSKGISIKRAFALFWHGLTALLAGMASWFTVILGMKDESKYGKFLRRTVGTCFALLMIMLVVAAGGDFCNYAYRRLALRQNFGDEYWDQRQISPFVTYYSFYSNKGYLKNSEGKKTITDIEWVATPWGADSLVCYSDGKKRGYFNMFTGQPVIEPKYRHAWVFSEGLASVDDGGWIKFIDASGRVVFDPRLPYVPGADGYIFHNGYCVLPQSGQSELVGLVDKQGRWALKPEYRSIDYSGDFWIVDNGTGKSVLDSTLATVLPFVDGQIVGIGEYINVTLRNHVMQRYTLTGELVNDFYINDVNFLTYDTDELRYSATKNYNEEGTLVSETEDLNPLPVQKMAKCRCYEAESGWYGLMTAGGQIVTPPSYTSITAIGYDLYLCKDNFEDGVILNGKGERVR